MLGANLLPDGSGARFAVWAPRARTIDLRLLGRGPDVPMRREGDVFTAVVPGAQPGLRYFYVLDGRDARPDPRSRFQPEGVHGPSELCDPARFAWRHQKPERPLGDYVLYELHVGTFTEEGSFAAAARALPALAELGVTAIEIMPVAAFPGTRNWGYDGVHLYAPCAAYGTPDDLRALIDAAHGLGLSVVMDVVYNHLGPEGNYLPMFAPYFTSARHTLWGDALDYERREVRDFFVDNACSWIEEYRADALRLDAVHAIVDPSPTHICAEICQRARPAVLIAETDMNEVKVFEKWGFDAAWSDDFHHALHACLTGERGGYYKDFHGPGELSRAIQCGWVRGPEPERSCDLPATRFVVASQNHDQVGNRALGERLGHLGGDAAARLAAVATLAAAPAVPLLFMGEEFAARTPFLYFTSHGDPQLGRAVTEGRRREFAELGFAWPDRIPDPQDERTFAASKLRRAEADAGMLRLYRDLLAMRRTHRRLGAREKSLCRARVQGEAVWVERSQEVLIALNLGRDTSVRAPEGWRPLLCSEWREYGGTLERAGDEVPPRAASVLVRSCCQRCC